MTLRYGLIGSGMMGQEHIRNVAALDGVEFTAVVDPDPGMREQAAELANANAYSDIDSLLSAEKLDALIIASPNYTHIDVLEQVLKTDLPILVEKPLCTTSADCKRIEQLANSSKAPIWVGMEYRYMPPIGRLIDEVQAGTIGDLKMISIREHRFPFLSKVGDWNRFCGKERRHIG